MATSVPAPYALFFFNDPAPTEIYTLSLHDALPISKDHLFGSYEPRRLSGRAERRGRRSEEHTSELQSRGHLVCRLLLEKKKHKTTTVVARPIQLTQRRKENPTLLELNVILKSPPRV